MVFGLDQAGALGGIDLLDLDVNTAAIEGVRLGRFAGLEVDPGVVADVVGAAGLVDAQEVDGAALVAELDADVVAVNGSGPVGDAVGVDLAAENTDRGRVLVVGSDGNTLGYRASGKRKDGNN